MMENSIKNSKIFFWFISSIFRDAFRVSIITFLLLMMFEDLKEGFVLNYFDLKILLFVCFISGLVSLFTSGCNLNEDNQNKSNNININK